MIPYYSNRIFEEFIFLRGKFLKRKLYNASQSISGNPFFIISPGRSGSTFLRKLMMLDGQINIPPESYDCIPKSIKFFILNHSMEWNILVNKICDIFNTDPGFKYWNIDLLQYKHHLYQLNDEEKTLRTIIDSIYRLHARVYSPSSKYYGDKTPLLALNLKWIDLLFPNTKFIFIYRDPVDIVYSRMVNFNESFDMSLKRVVWSFREMKKFQNSKKNEKILKLSYEGFVKDTDKSLDDIYSFLGINDRINKNKKQIYLGDDILPHHQNLVKRVNSKPIGKGSKHLNYIQIDLIRKETKNFC